MRHTHYLTMSRAGYTDTQLCTPPAAIAGDELARWAMAKVVAERGDHGWTVEITPLRPRTPPSVIEATVRGASK